MKLNRVDIKNFRGIDKTSIEFKEGFNLIKGENGKGKTSILEAISVGLGGYIAGVHDVDARHFSKGEIRKVISAVGDGSFEEKFQVPTEVVMNVKLDNKEYEWKRGRTSVQASRTTIQPRDICKKAEEICLSEDAEYPVLINLGAGRVWSQRRDKTENLFAKKYSRTVGYIDTLLEASNTKLLLNWCVKMEQVSWQKKMEIAEYEAVKLAVSRFMSLMNDERRIDVFYDRQLEEMVYCEEGQNSLISDLSAGYQSLVWMAFEIAYRMAVLNPNKRDEVTMTKGIVLIDEIDMHLHPKWQWKIINALRKVFPNVQFIATTHSPILFASAKDVWVIDIENEKYEYEYSHYGIDVNTSMKKYQGTDDILPEVQLQIERFYDYIDDENLEKAKEILEVLEQDTAPSHPTLIEMRTRYEFEIMDLEE